MASDWLRCPIRVAFVSRDAAWQKYRYDALNRLAVDKSIMVSVHTCADPKFPLPKGNRRLRWEKSRSWLPARWRAGFFPGAVLQVARERPDVVVGVNNASHVTEYLLFYLRRLLRLRFVWWTHGYDHFAKRGHLDRLRRHIMLGALKRADAVITFSAKGRATLIAAGLPPAKVFHAPNTLDTEHLTGISERYGRSSAATWRDEFSLDHGRRYILFTGRLTESKKVLLAAEVFRKVLDQRPACGWIVVGDGPARPALEQFVAANGMADAVRLVGEVHDDVLLAKLFAIADAFLMPANVGLAIVHSFCFGVPIVTSTDPTHGPELEYLNPGENGFIATGPHPIAEMADYLCRIMADSVLREKLSEGARKTVANEASIARQIDGMLSAFLYATGHNRGGQQGRSHEDRATARN